MPGHAAARNAPLLLVVRSAAAVAAAQLACWSELVLEVSVAPRRRSGYRSEAPLRAAARDHLLRLSAADKTALAQDWVAATAGAHPALDEDLAEALLAHASDAVVRLLVDAARTVVSRAAAAAPSATQH